MKAQAISVHFSDLSQSKCACVATPQGKKQNIKSALDPQPCLSWWAPIPHPTGNHYSAF